MFKKVTLEMSLKPFKQTDEKYIETVLRNIFEQWRPLIKNREVVSIMLFTADGSEILDYTGNMNKEFEWCKYLGTANKPLAEEDEPTTTTLHDKKRLYMKNPPVMTYGILKNIVEAIKRIGKELFPKSEIRVGEMFDIGPEFAVSDFKYSRHKEICTGKATELDGTVFLNSYARLNGDSYPYAAFPNGIPDGVHFATFLGRQSQVFLENIGFDYLWLANGVGFSASPWSSNGEVFDGEHFLTEKLSDVRSKIFGFWKLFRAECDYPIEVRGTNFSAGIDYATDAVPLYDIYNSNLNITPPPNSPWAALDGNFGLEIMGHLTRTCRLPEDDFMFRYYIHDPWWMNSPWYDRYEGQPHDIYLPMSLSRIDENGNAQAAGILNILTVDNSFGDTPDCCVNEPLPHILKAEKDSPDSPALFVWVYPLRKFTTATDKGSLQEMLSHDWFICEAINNGLPLSSCVDCDNFINQDKTIYGGSVLISPVPTANSEFEKCIIDYIDDGGKVLFCGNADCAGSDFLSRFGLTLTNNSVDKVIVNKEYNVDVHSDGIYSNSIVNREILCNGKINTVSENEGIKTENGYSLSSSYKNAVWYRASVSAKINTDGGHIIPDKMSEHLRSEVLLRNVLREFGYDISFNKPTANSKTPVIMVSKNNNATIFSVYTPDTTVETALKFPLGSPILLGYETEIKNYKSHYCFPRAEHRECRVFVEQNRGVVYAKEMAPVSSDFRRRICVSGLENATVRFFSEEYCKDNTFCIHRDDYTPQYINHGGYEESDVEYDIISSPQGTYYEIKNVTGTLFFCMPFKK